MNRFEKISETQYTEDKPATECVSYNDIKLPVRATKYSAGYDFFSTIDFTLQPGETVKIPTFIRARLGLGKFLLIAPRSGLGFKYRLQLDNTIGIIDADYYNSSNEGHIWIKLTNDSKDGKTLHVNIGDAIAQGIITGYSLTEDDCVETVRNGGFGSTDAKK